MWWFQEIKTVIDLGTLTDEYEPEITIHTTAADKATGEKSIVAGKSVTIVDTVTLDGLKKGTKYQLKGWQMVKAENAQLLVDGKALWKNDYTFYRKRMSRMEIEMTFTLQCQCFRLAATFDNHLRNYTTFPIQTNLSKLRNTRTLRTTDRL